MSDHDHDQDHGHDPRSGSHPPPPPPPPPPPSQSHPPPPQSSHHQKSKSPAPRSSPSHPRPSASVIVLSSNNEVLLVHRLHNARSYPSAHVFPGGNVVPFHDGPLPPHDSPRLHDDLPVYRYAAIRETFEESGLLLARRKGFSSQDGLLTLQPEERDIARQKVYTGELNFQDWVESMGGVLDVDNLHPFTRWITPTGNSKRYTTQMYLYMLPLPYHANPMASLAHTTSIPEPEPTLTSPDGNEVTTTEFADAHEWLDRLLRRKITLFPPQAYLIQLLADFCVSSPSASPLAQTTFNPDSSSPTQSSQQHSISAFSHRANQREQLLSFLRRTPTSSGDSSPRVRDHPASHIPWSHKVICPVIVRRMDDGRSVLALESPGDELRGTARAGDYERVVLVRYARDGPEDVEVKRREEVMMGWGRDGGGSVGERL